MSVRVGKSARRGVSGDCQRHHSQHKRWNQPTVLRNSTIPYTAMRSILPQSGESTLIAATASNLAYKLQPASDEPIQAEIQDKAPPVKLATDGGNIVKGNDEYQLWLEAFAWTRKAKRKSVVYLAQPGDTLRAVHTEELRPIVVNGIQLGTLRQRWLLTQYVPTSWHKVKAEHLKRAANSRKERLNNVHHTAVVHAEKVADFGQSLVEARIKDESTLHQPLPEAQPWVVDEPAQNDADHTTSVEQATQSPTDGFMEQVHLMRQTRQDAARAEHLRSPGFMHDVTNQRLGATQYYERMKYVRSSAINKRLSDTMYANRRAFYHCLYKHGDVCIDKVIQPRPLPGLKNSDSSRTAATPSPVKSASEEAFACMYHNYTNREFWNGPPQEVPAKPYRFPETDEIISRAQQRIDREDKERAAAEEAVLTQDIECQDASYYRSWLRGHAHRSWSPFDRNHLLHVHRRMHQVFRRKVRETLRRNKVKSDNDLVRYMWWLTAYQHRRFTLVDAVIQHSVIARLLPSKPVTIDVFSQCNNLMQKTWRALNRADYGSLSHTVAQMTKGMLLPSTHVTNRDPAMAKPRGKS